MKIRVRDLQAEAKAWEEHERKLSECASRPFPHNVPNFLPLGVISCYREIDTEDLYFDEEGRLCLKPK